MDVNVECGGMLEERRKVVEDDGGPASPIGGYRCTGGIDCWARTLEMTRENQRIGIYLEQ